jgi:hypothetical protein
LSLFQKSPLWSSGKTKYQKKNKIRQYFKTLRTVSWSFTSSSVASKRRIEDFTYQKAKIASSVWQYMIVLMKLWNLSYILLYYDMTLARKTKMILSSILKIRLYIRNTSFTSRNLLIGDNEVGNPLVPDRFFLLNTVTCCYIK